MLVERRRLVTFLDPRTDYQHWNLASSVCRVTVERFVEDDYQQAVLLERGAVNQRRDVRLQPAVSLIQSSIVAVVEHIRSNVGELRKLVVIEIAGKFGERNQVLQLILAIHHVRNITEWIVMLRVRINVSANVPDAGQTFNVCLPGFTRGQ